METSAGCSFRLEAVNFTSTRSAAPDRVTLLGNLCDDCTSFFSYAIGDAALRSQVLYCGDIDIWAHPVMRSRI